MSKKKVIVSYKLLREGLEELEQEFDVTYPTNQEFTREELKQMLPEYDALLSNFTLSVDKELIDAAGSRLKIVSNYAVGYNNVDTDYAREKGITVTNTPDPVVEPTAELAYALMGCAARRIAEKDRQLRTPQGVKWGILEQLGHSMYGKTLGIIGMGRIGQSIARRAGAGEMNIIYHNRHQLNAETEKQFNATYKAELNELLQQSDYVMLATPLTNETRHLINKETLGQMKPNAIIVNISRGPVIDEEALVEALNSKQIAGAALDVYEKEPFINKGLLALDNVVLSPHCGTSTVDARVAMAKFASANIINFFKGTGRVCKVN